MTHVSAATFIDHIADLEPAIEGLRLGEYSDLIDEQGHQYVDLVMEGGGTLGVALLGYLHVLEAVGLRFIGIGGTSVGAITAVALAAANRPSDERAAPLIEALANMPMADFVDGRKPGDDDAMTALQAWLDPCASWLEKTFKVVQVMDNFRSVHALNRGDAFHQWIDQLLRGLNAGQPLTAQQLRIRMNDVPTLLVRDTADEADFRGQPDAPYWEIVNHTRVYQRRPVVDQLCVIAADITTETKIRFPTMAELFWRQPDDVNVADFARASMAVPGFFAPFELPALPADEVREIWRAEEWPDRCYEGDFLPPVHKLVDGGVLSNFPIDAFHQRTRVPLRPTFGVKLQWDEHRHVIDNVLQIFLACFNTARHAMDAEFLRRNPDYNKLVAYIDTEDVHWLDFAMSTETKLRLFRMGALTAVAFLRGFNWRDYKRIRRAMAEAHVPGINARRVLT